MEMEENILKQFLQAKKIHFLIFMHNETKEVIFSTFFFKLSAAANFNNLSDNISVDLNYLSIKEMYADFMSFSVD